MFAFGKLFKILSLVSIDMKETPSVIVNNNTNNNKTMYAICTLLDNMAVHMKEAMTFP